MGPKGSWKYLLIIAVITVQVATQLYLSSRADRSLVGFTRGTETAGKGLLVEDVTPGLPGEKAGLKPGDLIVAVDQYPIRTEGNYDSYKLHHLNADQPAHFTILRDGNTVHLTVIPYSRFVPIKYFVALILVFGCILLGAFCYWKNPSDARTQMLLFIFLSFAVSDSWLSPSWFGDWPFDRVLLSLYLFIDGIGYGLLTLLPFFVPERKAFLVRRPWLALLFLIPGFAYSILSVVNSEYSISHPGSEVISSDYLFVFEDYYLSAIFLLIPLVLFHTMRKASTPLVRNQAKIMVVGVTLWAVLNSLVIACQKVYPESWIADDYYATIVDIIIPISVFFAVYRHRLFNIDVLIRKGLIYTAASGALLSIYLLGIGVLGWLLAGLVSSDQNVTMLTTSLSTLVVGLAFIPVRHYSQKLIDRLFYREKYNYLAVINTIFDEIPAAFSLEKLIETLSHRVFSAMRIKNVAVLIPDEEHQRYFLRSRVGDFPGSSLETRIVLVAGDSLIVRLLQDEGPLYGKSLRNLSLQERETQVLELLGTKLVMPVLHQKKLVAILLLGEKQSETGFDGEDLSFLNTIARQAAMLMENARLLELASYDGLTQLLRRTAFDAVLEAEIQRSARYRRPLSLIMLDLDHFKKLNDSWGHQAGDLVLKKVAATLKSSLRQTDTPSRYGGEEFAILLPEASQSAALIVAENLRSRLEELELKLDDKHSIDVTASLGVYTVEDSEAHPIQDVYRRADSALYEAKAAGRNRVKVYAGPSHIALPVI